MAKMGLAKDVARKTFGEFLDFGGFHLGVLFRLFIFEAF